MVLVVNVCTHTLSSSLRAHSPLALRQSQFVGVTVHERKNFGILLIPKGRVPERPKGTDCKSVGLCLRRFESCRAHIFICTHVHVCVILGIIAVFRIHFTALHGIAGMCYCVLCCAITNGSPDWASSKHSISQRGVKFREQRHDQRAAGFTVSVL